MPRRIVSHIDQPETVSKTNLIHKKTTSVNSTHTLGHSNQETSVKEHIMSITTNQSSIPQKGNKTESQESWTTVTKGKKNNRSIKTPSPTTMQSYSNTNSSDRTAQSNRREGDYDLHGDNITPNTTVSTSSTNPSKSFDDEMSAGSRYQKENMVGNLPHQRLAIPDLELPFNRDESLNMHGPVGKPLGINQKHSLNRTTTPDLCNQSGNAQAQTGSIIGSNRHVPDASFAGHGRSQGSLNDFQLHPQPAGVTPTISNKAISTDKRSTQMNLKQRPAPHWGQPVNSYQTIAVQGIMSHPQHMSHDHNMLIEQRQDPSPGTSPTSSFRMNTHSQSAIGSLAHVHKMQHMPVSPNAYIQSRNASGRQHVMNSAAGDNSRRNQGNPPMSPSWQHQNPQSYRSQQQQHSKYNQPNSPGSHGRNQPGGKPFTSGGSRPAPEVLKTLLRKKACLYESGTSRAIALITWLVGRSLAVHDGFFSRQKLQSGVHAVVASKITSGMITRTKVNRCMQIILNSCFHYIIPKPDGADDKGGAFRESFKKTAIDDAHLLKSLSSPWDDVDITKADEIIYSEDNFHDDGDKKNDNQTEKRVVLLCFNENVRSAEDVLRCHNDFIRDTAIGSNLILTSDEWRYFFSRKDEDGSHTSSTIESIPSGPPQSPVVRGMEGCDIPYLSFDIPSEVSDCLSFNDKNAEPWGKEGDILGQMNSNELFKFRTSWCCKRYEHDHKLCRFAHADQNQGWLRRDPSVFKYSDEMCQFVATVQSENSILHGCQLNSCKDGVHCKFAHSKEEVDYHPKCYKSKVCQCSKTGGNFMSHPCKLLDICPNAHPLQSGVHYHHRGNKRRGDSFSKGKGSPKLGSRSKEEEFKVPEPAHVLYLNPSPLSEFDRSLVFPGLVSLYRRNCSVHYAHHVGCKAIAYNLFGGEFAVDSPFEKSQGTEKKDFSFYSK